MMEALLCHAPYHAPFLWRGRGKFAALEDAGPKRVLNSQLVGGYLMRLVASLIFSDLSLWWEQF